MKKAILALLIFCLSLIFPVFCTAKSNFSEEYNVSYNVDQNAITHASYNIRLTNLTSNYYVQSYNLDLEFKDLTNVSALTASGNIPVTIIKSPKGSSIQLKFDNRVTGLKKTLSFNLAFDTKDITKNLNNIWDINIPGIIGASDYSSFNATVIYPETLGEPAFIKPYISGMSTASGVLKFTKNNLEKSGISISFGDYQIYDLNLKYHLQNKNVFPIITEIALPPDTGYQTVQINEIVPKPFNVIRDVDGNWIAKYKLSSLQKIDVSVKGKVKVILTPAQEEINPQLKASYLSPQTYWEAGDPNIINLAKQLKTPQNIYQYVVNKLNYDYSRVIKDSQRVGAVDALKKPTSAVCLEFTDLFIALARAAGIPAREVDGYAYTTNATQRPVSLVKDVLHAWPEYYDFDKNEWIMIDPTWGNTTGGIDYFKTLDFEHIAFVIRGQNSSYPIPAGGYKLDTAHELKDVDVKIGNSFNENKQISIKAEINSPEIAGIPIQDKLLVLNQGNQVINNEIINVSVSKLTPATQRVITDSILPYGEGEVKIGFTGTSFLTKTQDTIKITLGNKTFLENIEILPFFKNKYIALGGIVLVICSIILSIIAFNFRRLSIRRRKR